MLRSTQALIKHQMQRHIIRDEDLAQLFKGSPARRYGLVNKALKKGELIRLRRGLYTLPRHQLDQPFSNLYIANRLVTHSFVTAESALSFHGWIPEQVRQTVSVCAFGRKREFETPQGDFIYYPTPVEPHHFYNGVELIEQASHMVYVATPLRALIDMIYLNKIKQANSHWLKYSLRIEEEHIFNLKTKEINQLMPVYRSTHVLNFLANLRSEKKNG